MGKRIPIFYYHSIGGKGPETLSLGRFKDHLGLLKRLNFKAITFSEALQENLDNAENHAVLSFDDGLLDNYENALPILLDHGYRATFFIIPSFDKLVRWVDPQSRRWSDFKKNGHTIPFPAMGAWQRKELVKLEMEVGSHSLSHPKLNKIPRDSLRAELVDSKSLLEDELGIEIKSFCYPKGRYNKNVLDLLERAGYQGACTTMPGYFKPGNNAFTCPRFLVENHSLFKTLLEFAKKPNPLFESIFSSIRPPLGLKNVFL